MRGITRRISDRVDYGFVNALRIRVVVRGLIKITNISEDRRTKMCQGSLLNVANETADSRIMLEQRTEKGRGFVKNIKDYADAFSYGAQKKQQRDARNVISRAILG